MSNLIKPNQLIIRGVICKFLILRGVWVFFVVRRFPDLAIFGKVQERPGMAGEENSSMAGSGFFQNFHHGEWGGEEGSCLCSRSCIA